MAINDGLFSSLRDDWETPGELFNQLNDEFSFTLDAASSDENAKLEKHYTKENDGLSKSWEGETVFCNPPYGKAVRKWVEKAFRESLKPNTTVVLLIPSRTDTSYFHDYLYKNAELRFLRGRVKFERGGGCSGNSTFSIVDCNSRRKSKGGLNGERTNKSLCRVLPFFHRSERTFL